jgi:hypothetical protein
MEATGKKVTMQWLQGNVNVSDKSVDESGKRNCGRKTTWN